MIPDAPDAAPTFSVPEASELEVEEAVEHAVASFRTWRRSSGPERAAVLRSAGDGLLARRKSVADVLVRETGKPIRQAAGEVDRAAAALKDFAAHLETDAGRALTDFSRSVWGLELREPRGPSAVLTTWNMPIQIGAIKVGAALAAGCTVVVKPSPLAPVSMLALHDALSGAGLPPGCLTVLQGESHTAELLARHPEIKVVSVTGQTSTGQQVMAQASRTLKKLILELGGKSANIVFGDADLDLAVEGIVAGFVRNQGAACTAATRVLVEDKVYDEVVARVATRIATVTVGDPHRRDTAIGAIRHRDLFSALQDALDGARRRGYTPRGGQRVAVHGRSGDYLQPAVLAGVPNTDPLAQVEHFGPIACISPFTSASQATQLANSTSYGLAAGVWSRDASIIDELCRELDVGTVYVNSYHRIDGIPLPAEGRGASGFGIETGRGGIEEFRCAKSIHIPIRGLLRDDTT